MLALVLFAQSNCRYINHLVVLLYQAIGHEQICFIVVSILQNCDIMLNHISVSSPDKESNIFPCEKHYDIFKLHI